MRKPDELRVMICPRCGRNFAERPALSRKDHKTQICPDCGTREALESIGVSADEQEEIIKIMHENIQ
jgi:DNA-directed RNA polymerase subunit RPC12/RpoP